MSAPLLEVRGLCVTFHAPAGPVPAVRGAALSLRAGEMLGVVGESGSGKSATLLALMGLPGAGAVVAAERALFRGRNLLGAPRPPGPGGMGMVFQDARAALNPLRPVGLQLADVLARHDPAPPALLRARVLAALRAVRIADPARRAAALPGALSGGMCQRVGIALALAAAPALLLADEPTTGLDPVTEAAVMALLREAAQNGAGVVLVTHDLALAAAHCDRILVMRDGAVVEEAPAATLFATPRHPFTAQLLRGLPAAMPAPAPRPVAAAPPVLELRGARRHFAAGRWRLFRRRARLPAVDGVSLAVRPGEAVGLVGESGCGKSTLARLAAGLLRPDGGDVLLRGQSIGRLSAGRLAASPLRAEVQMAFQDPAGSLDPRRSAFDAIATPLRRLRGLRGAALRDRVTQAAAEAGFPPSLLARLPHRLSGGEAARAGLARALAPRPRLLVLDEPTAALDASRRAAILRRLGRLRDDSGVAVLLVSHDLHAVRLLCDRVLVMQAGQVVEEGPVAQVFARPRHPYTAALLAALPRLPGTPAPDAPPLLDAEPRSPVDPDPRSCRLHGRCPRGAALCGVEAPALRQVAAGWGVRCHFPRGGERPGE
ncbi:ABC transporter ATP-binding protein [Roseomonas haemaphysalidis]|uniref:ABC transporter ATP-binding protein n=1 Tax=Roseomonas haemaphysalidis TaxID=2768162 RepID=UPI001F2989EA|nr:ABC transporter ATP-binding protein [Roseomonas haemaphysalidis]